MSKRRRSSGSRRVAEAKFWGEAVDDVNHGAAADNAAADNAEGGDVEAAGQGAESARADGGVKTGPGETVMVRPTPDPGALVRSLGAPPLAVDAGLAERHLTAVYEEAVRAATALAAASGLLALSTDDA
jgi:hypothetical protein